MRKLAINTAVVIAAVAGLAVAPGTPPSTGGSTHPVAHHHAQPLARDGSVPFR